MPLARLCLEFIRAAIAQAHQEFAHQIAAIVKEVCDPAYADRATIWAELSPIEQQQWSALLAGEDATARDLTSELIQRRA